MAQCCLWDCTHFRSKSVFLATKLCVQIVKNYNPKLFFVMEISTPNNLNFNCTCRCFVTEGDRVWIHSYEIVLNIILFINFIAKSVTSYGFTIQFVINNCEKVLVIVLYIAENLIDIQKKIFSMGSSIQQPITFGRFVTTHCTRSGLEKVFYGYG